MRKAVKKVLISIAIVVLVLIVLVGLTLAMAFAGLEETTNLEIGTVDLAQIPDGSYTGSYTNFRWNTTVKVTVTDHQITAIEPVKIQSGRKNLARELTEDILQQQTADVDVVSGATASSHAYLKAVENALIEGAEG
jgi:uncharacterized protein with FMN-binding domain